MTLDTDTPIIASLNAYLPDGTAVKLSFDIGSIFSEQAPIADQMATWLQTNNFSSTLPGHDLPAGSQVDAIAYVIRKQKRGDQTPIIAFYNREWGNKYGHLYLNDQMDIDEFEAQSGLKLNDLPLYNGKDYPAKDDDEFNQYAIRVKRDLQFFRTPKGTFDDGKTKYK